ncbi:MAG: hypothetical protein MUE44_00780 [Oscillatoriaceae cyanobacterium Prado104]|jgi:hypothetical protein|nr:hypothetical protein [Oscillatoriaceae cyanobacterium Prado104]
MPKFDKPKLNKSKLNQSEFDGSNSTDDCSNKSKSLPTAKLPPVQLDETIVAGHRPKKLSQLERLLMEMPNFHISQLAFPADIAGDDPVDVKEFESRISKILNAKNIDVNVKKLTKYLEYLKQNIKFPCRVTGREEFIWEEEYLFGGGSKKQYEKLKKTQPSYTDTFAISQFEDAFDTDEGIIVKVQRLSDKKEFILPLVELEASDNNSPNDRLLDDYSTWFANY